MSDSLGIAIAGAAGRMGQMLLAAVEDREDCHLAGLTEHEGHALIGTAYGGVTYVSNTAEAISGAQALIDFTRPENSVQNARACADAGILHVIGTTGFTKADLAEIGKSAEKTPIIRAGNMSLGVNVLTVMARKLAAALDDEFDIEVVEMHHKHKVDAPSGTALMLGEAAAEGREISLGDMADRGRDGITGERERGRIGFAALRGGDVVGEHDVIFAAPGERVVLRHLATDRNIFARGAVKAAIWGQGKPAGEYSMLDVLGLND
jgi:4-hydroxy-tetrahydrodipicolinate reductase